MSDRTPQPPVFVAPSPTSASYPWEAVEEEAEPTSKVAEEAAVALAWLGQGVGLGSFSQHHQKSQLMWRRRRKWQRKRKRKKVWEEVLEP